MGWQDAPTVGPTKRAAWEDAPVVKSQDSDDIREPQPITKVSPTTGLVTGRMAPPSEATPSPDKEPASPRARTTEIRADNTPKWKYWVSEHFPALAETIGAIGGGVGGTVAGAPTGAWAPAVGVAGAAAGSGYGRLLANDIMRWLDIPRTQRIVGTKEGEFVVEPPQGPLQEFTDASKRGAYLEMGGQIVGKALPAVTGYLKDKALAGKDMFASGQIRAGEVLNKAQQLSPLEAHVPKETAKLNASAKRLGVSRLPETTSPNIRQQALALSRSTNPDIKASEQYLAKTARSQATRGLDRVIPPPLERHVANVRAELEAFEAAAKARKAPTPSGVAAATQNLESTLPGRINVQTSGAAVQKRVGYGQQQAGPSFVKEEFNKLYAPFDTNPAAVSSTDDFAAALAGASQTAKESGLVLKNFIPQGDKMERMLASVSDDGAALPSTFPVSTWRNIKGELNQVAQDAAKAGNYQAARELKIIADIAKAGETTAIAKLPQEMVENYAKVSKAYKNLYVEGFRKGFVGAEMLRPGGKELGAQSLASGDVMKKLLNVDNADSLMHALGAEQVVAQGKTLSGLGAKEIQALGRKEAGQIVKSYIEHTIAAKYAAAGGGKRGAAAISKYLRDFDTLAVLEKYNLNSTKIAKAAAKVDAAAVTATELSGAVLSEQGAAVSTALGITDPYVIGKHVLNNANPRVALQKLYMVKNGAAWRQSINGLIKEELKGQINAGKNIFTDKKAREILPAMFSKTEIRALKDYHQIVENLQRSATRLDTGIGGTATALKSAQNMSVGVGKWYLMSKAIRFVLKGATAAREQTVAKYLDAALIDPKKATLLIDAFKQSGYGKRRLGTEFTNVDIRLSNYMRANQAAAHLSAYPIRKKDDAPQGSVEE